MIIKNYSKGGKICRTTFKIPAQLRAQSAILKGDFNNWEPSGLPMKQLRDGSFSATLSLEAGKTYRFKYLLDDLRWENDWQADSYLDNQFGTQDSVVDVTG